MGGFSTIVEAVRTTDGKGPQRLSPFTVPAFLANLAAGQVSIGHQLQGPLKARVTACTASIQAIGDAARLIRNDEADAVGYGTSADAYHVTSGPEDGSGAARSMRAALRQARLQPHDIQHLNAHATSTLVGDRGELAAIRQVFGAGSGPSITATKSAMGQMLGAAGAAAAIFTILALRDQIAPHVLNLEHPDPLADGLDLIAGSARAHAMEHAMLNGFGFGGVNASLVLKRFSA